MMKLNDGSMKPPRLEIVQSWWGMIGVGDGEREWTVEEKFEKLAEQGYTGILGRFPLPIEADTWRRMLDDYKFSFGVHCFPYRREDLQSFYEQVQVVGADFVNCHIMNNFVVGRAAETLIRDLIDEAKGYSIPFFVETHRGRVTQDLHRTVDYVNAIPDLRLTIDLSHYALAGEMEHISEQASELFDRLLRRTSCIHGRISNGQQIQVDIGPNAEHPLVESYTNLWSKGMAYWLEQADPGDILPVLPELGPPNYAITSDSYIYGGQHRQEISDRWQQALIIKNLFFKAWDAVAANIP